MSSQSLSQPRSITPGFSDPSFLGDKFKPGRWLDRRQLDVPSCTVIGGCYERQAPVVGGFHTEDVHFFDLSLAGRPADAKGRLVDCFREPQPLGEIIFVPAGHRYVGGGGQGTQRNLFVFLNAGSLREEDAPVADALGLPRLQEFMNLRSDRVRFLLTQISQELYNPGFASELMIEGLATTLLVETARLFQQTPQAVTTRGGLAPVTLRKIRERVLDGGKPPSLGELAELCKLSRRHLMRAFRESTGQTVGQFIQHTILAKARHLLQNTDKPVSVIASELGFVSASAFSTAFRRLTGESPSTFRVRESAYESELNDFSFSKV